MGVFNVAPNIKQVTDESKTTNKVDASIPSWRKRIDISALIKQKMNSHIIITTTIAHQKNSRGTNRVVSWEKKYNKIV